VVVFPLEVSNLPLKATDGHLEVINLSSSGGLRIILIVTDFSLQVADLVGFDP